MKRRVIVALAVIMGLLIVGGVFMWSTDRRNHLHTSTDTAPSLLRGGYLGSLDRQAKSSMTTDRLDKNLAPPTNKWFSGMVLPGTSQPGFSVPNSVLLHMNGLEMGLPTITSKKDGIYGPHSAGVTLTAHDARSYKLTRYDELTMTLTYYGTAKEPSFEVTMASGSPYVYITALREVKVRLGGAAYRPLSSNVAGFHSQNAWYGAYLPGGITNAEQNIQKGRTLTLYSARSQRDVERLAAFAPHRITGGQVKYDVTKTQVRTTLSYRTHDGGPTILVRTPHQAAGEHAEAAVSYPSIYGELRGYVANTITYSAPVQPLRWTLQLEGMPRDKKEHLRRQLALDIAATRFDKSDTYFGGKQLQRTAQLVMLADTLDDNKLRSSALDKLRPALREWFDGKSERSFYYDSVAKTLVGRKASFGSDTELNDHHFHYGYFIYAASVAARFDERFLAEYQSHIDALVADIANYSTNEALGLRRAFDAYAGHSWASGIAPYADGNNQESSSEAVNAWTAVGLWADVTRNRTLRDEAAWLLASEVATAKQYWLKPSDESSYGAPLVSINWGGKREYRTFFSDEPNAKLAIQLLPLTPTMQQYVADLPNDLYRGVDDRRPFADYIVMARGGSGAFARVVALPDSLIDDGNSRAYAMAYVLSKTP